MKATTSTHTTDVAQRDDDYKLFELVLAERIASTSGPFFTTDADPVALWNAYLDGIPDQHRQHYNCRCCQRFIQRYGGLVTVNKDTGDTTPVLWMLADVPEFFLTSVAALQKLVRRARVNGVFVWGANETTWGTPRTRDKKHGEGFAWSHLHGVPRERPWVLVVQTAEQRAASLLEERGMLCRALADYSLAATEQALRVLKADTLRGAEKARECGEWFHNLQRQRNIIKGKNQRENVVWYAAALAPPGWCHVRSGMIGTLLDDVVAGLDYNEIAARWMHKMHPLQYRRPKAEPNVGQIKAAEDLVAKMGLAPSLERRYATAADVLPGGVLWKPPSLVADAQASQEGAQADGKKEVFGHLKPNAGKTVKEIELPPQPITWEKFARTVMPNALSMELRTPVRGNYCGVVTATHADAPPLLQWDGLKDCERDAEGRQTDGEFDLPRNPVSWYIYMQGSSAHQWDLDAGTWVEITHLLRCPAHWQQPEKFTHFKQMCLVCLKGARDRSGERAMTSSPGLGLFPEILRSELHGARSVIEAHSNKGVLTGGDAPDQVNGLLMVGGEGGSMAPVFLRVVLTTGGRATYKIDRWD